MSKDLFGNEEVNRRINTKATYKKKVALVAEQKKFKTDELGLNASYKDLGYIRLRNNKTLL